MKKLLILLLSAFSLTTFAQEKQVAILEPIAMTKEVSTMHRSMVRGEMVKAFGRQSGYAAFTRTDIDQIMAEQNFQQSGMVDDATRKRIGAMQGVDYVCVTKITKEGNNYYLEANLVNIETGKISNPATQYGELTGGSLSNMLAACEKLAAELVGKKIQTTTTYKAPTISYPSSPTPTTTTPATKPATPSYTSATIISCDSDVDVAIVSCKRNGDNVVFKFRMTNVGLGGSCSLLLAPANGVATGSFIFDNLGNTYNNCYITLGNNNNQRRSNVGVTIPLDVPVQGSVTVENVPSNASTMTFKLGVSPCIGKSWTHMTFKNVPIY